MFSVSVVIKLFYLSAEIPPEEEEKASTEKYLMKNYRLNKKNNKGIDSLPQIKMF